MEWLLTDLLSNGVIKKLARPRGSSRTSRKRQRHFHFNWDDVFVHVWITLRIFGWYKFYGLALGKELKQNNYGLGNWFRLSWGVSLGHFHPPFSGNEPWPTENVLLRTFTNRIRTGAVDLQFEILGRERGENYFLDHTHLPRITNCLFFRELVPIFISIASISFDRFLSSSHDL